MPQIIVKGMTPEDVRLMSENTLSEIARINETPEEYYIFQHCTNTYFERGKESAIYPLVEVVQFERSREQEKETAKYLCQYIHSLGYPTAEIYYVHLREQDYYEWTGTELKEYIS